jgi:predicted nucleotidyltransferase
MLIDSSLLNETLSTLRSIYGERLAKIILYGSYARGEQTPESDIDLLVVL